MTSALILVTNDDGYRAPGIEALAKALKALGRVLVVAPESPQSAVSHTITLHKPLRLSEARPDWFVCSGSPADCAYLGIHALCADTKPQLVVSGINRGPNLGNDVFYSGTVAGAMEGLLLGYPAMAVSQAMSARDEFGGPATPSEVDYQPAADLTVELAREVLSRGLPPGVLLNLNVPAHYDRQQGVKLSRLGCRLYGDSFSRRLDPRGRPYYWIGGNEVGSDPIPGTDCEAVETGFAALTPIRADLTHENALSALSTWNLGRLPSGGDEGKS